MINHTSAVARTINVAILREQGTKTIKAACGKRIPTASVVSVEESNCIECDRQIAAGIAAEQRTGRARY